MKSRKPLLRRVILASGSEERRKLLKKSGISFVVRKSGYRENLRLKLLPRKLAKHLALEKARRVAARTKNAIVIGTDTFVVIDGEVIGKPRNRAHARKILEKLSGRKHIIITGYAFIDSDTGRATSRAVATSVWFRTLDAREIGRYVRSGEGLGAAGAYRIQKGAAKFVTRIRGDKDNVIGLPARLVQDLRQFRRRR